MPALTHGRVKNGFNGPIRKKNAKAHCPKAPNAIKVACNKTNVERRGALIGGIGEDKIDIAEFDINQLGFFESGKNLKVYLDHGKSDLLAIIYNQNLNDGSNVMEYEIQYSPKRKKPNP